MKNTLFGAAVTLFNRPAPADYGPGPQTLLTGDTTLGYFGQMPMADLVSSSSLSSLIPFTKGSVLGNGNAWLKFIDNGKVLYVAKTPLRNKVDHSDLKTAGIAYGKEVTIKGRRFKVRLMTGGDADPSTKAGGEWNRVMYGVANSRPAGTPVLASFTDYQLGIVINADGSASWCQEIHGASGRPLFRGGGNTNAVQAYNGGQNIGSNAFVFGWRPVLELIE